jgi:hypothetical protein
MIPPLSVPIHSAPSPSSRSAVIRLLVMPAVFALVKTVNRTPSNRARPSIVASHR